ncbi:hypothetical protein GCM10027280_53820 [Micromonospora polyrhachis]
MHRKADPDRRVAPADLLDDRVDLLADWRVLRRQCPGEPDGLSMTLVSTDAWYCSYLRVAAATARTIRAPTCGTTSRKPVCTYS